MAFFNKDMVALATKNTHFQKEVYLDSKVQVVLMHLLPGEEIGEETHPADQTTFFVSGAGQAVVDGARAKVGSNVMIIIPKGAKHNIVNKGAEPLKLFSVYAPPAESHGVKFKTKAEAEEAEKGIVTKAVEKVKKALSDPKKADQKKKSGDKPKKKKK